MTSLAMTAPCGSPGHHHAFTPLWDEKQRAKQLKQLKRMQLQKCDSSGEVAHQMVLDRVASMHAEIRMDVPSSRLISALLGLLRTCVTVKSDPIDFLELSAQQIADLIGYSRSQVEAALRWLGEGAILYFGFPVAQGLGLIKRDMRWGKGRFCTKIALACRTSLTSLTEAGRDLLGLATDQFSTMKEPIDKAKEHRRNWAKKRTIAKAKAEAAERARQASHIYYAQTLPVATPALEDNGPVVELRCMDFERLEWELKGVKHCPDEKRRYVFPDEREYESSKKPYRNTLLDIVNCLSEADFAAVPSYLKAKAIRV